MAVTVKETKASKLKAALILDSTTELRFWQFQALQSAVKRGLDVTTLLHCTDQFPRRISRKHAAYYSLALIGRRRLSMLRHVDARPILRPDIQAIRFKSEWEGNWQRIPKVVSESLSDVDVVVKFGMNLLRDPGELPSRYGVLGFHHGDPQTYRGRPAGFYEMLEEQDVVGVIVQRLCNILDAGEVLAQAYSPVVPTSYASTLNGAYRAGIPLLSKAIDALKDGSGRTLSIRGRRTSLPSNALVLRLSAKMSRRQVQRLLYGTVREKRWRVGRLTSTFSPQSENILRLSDVDPVPIPRGYTFVADPTGLLNGAVYCEVMSRWTGKGRIAAYSMQGWRFVDLPTGGGHLSYPQIVEFGGKAFLFPEMARIGPPTLFLLDADGLRCKLTVGLKGLESERLVDATLFQKEEDWYLFGGRLLTAGNELCMWTSKELFGPWRLHEESPICLDPRGARMAGPILCIDGTEYRLGQDGSRGYGRAIEVFAIESMSPDSYVEKRVGRVTMDRAFGPHSILSDGGGLLLDYFYESWAPLAGFRRAVSRFDGVSQNLTGRVRRTRLR